MIKKLKLVPDMLNLLGCNKENFIKLMEKMNYKSSSKNQEIYFKYNLKKKLKKIDKNKNINDDNPFNILKEMRIEIMFDIFKNNKKNLKKDNNLYINIGALLIHVAKIDENYSEKEKEIIKKTLLELGLTKRRFR